MTAGSEERNNVMQQESDSQLSDDHPTNPPTPKQIRRWQQYLANERAEAAVYRELARNREGEEKEILLAMARAEERHEQYWRTMLGDDLGFPRAPSFSTRIMGFLAKRFGTVFTLAMMQTAESRSPYADDADATEQMTADEAIHAEVVRGLAARGREKMSGNFRAAVFGANDGLVSNFALVLGVMGAGGIDSNIILLTGISGMLAGALHGGWGIYFGEIPKRIIGGIPPAPGNQHRGTAIGCGRQRISVGVSRSGNECGRSQGTGRQGVCPDRTVQERGRRNAGRREYCGGRNPQQPLDGGGI